ncbi:MAG: hypothetical protein IJ282_00290 [Lachnospiraceae bacterium]|nr:hypothetical protein [Lachnospiraceae bacterium]
MNNLGDKSNFFKNPIGVIGIFLVLVEAIASFVIVQSTLEKSQNTILVWFIVLFPCLVLGVFYLLVTKHHEKLYSPSDYRDEQNFMKSYNNTTRKEEIKKVTNEQNIECEIDQMDKVGLMNDALVKIMELQKKIVPSIQNSTLTEDEKEEYVSSIDDYLFEMEEEGEPLKVDISPMYKANYLVEELESKGFWAEIYHSPFGTKKLVSNAEHKAIWLGSEVPVDMAIEVIKLSKEFYPHLNYIELSDGSHDEPEYVLYQIYIGGATRTAKRRKLKALENEDFEELYRLEDKQSLHAFVKSFQA